MSPLDVLHWHLARKPRYLGGDTAPPPLPEAVALSIKQPVMIGRMVTQGFLLLLSLARTRFAALLFCLAFFLPQGPRFSHFRHSLSPCPVRRDPRFPGQDDHSLSGGSGPPFPLIELVPTRT